MIVSSLFASEFSCRCESWVEEGKQEAITGPRTDQTEQSKREEKDKQRAPSAVEAKRQVGQTRGIIREGKGFAIPIYQ